MSVSTLMIFSGAAAPSSVVNLSIGRTSWLRLSCDLVATCVVGVYGNLSPVVYRECRRH
jgi:hypothetical protein